MPLMGSCADRTAYLADLFARIDAISVPPPSSTSAPAACPSDPCAELRASIKEILARRDTIVVTPPATERTAAPAPIIEVPPSSGPSVPVVGSSPPRAARPLSPTAGVLLPAAARPSLPTALLRLIGYSSTWFPGWVMDISCHLTNLISIKVWNLPNCSNLPPLGQLPRLEKLILDRLPSIKIIDREFCGGKGAFNGMTSLSIEDMEGLEEWKYSVEDGVEEFMFPVLHSVNIYI
ncbi:hypothetical protein U9M48_001432 [Paspalum notatum var. saurae]|uniref:R13L1/DRL21-like LRR repeat region domain-containing protein n=1 Tax=Paspalum notatum var. saurae TaxID=547442 RepID=A0AAQ3SF76_PASNO